MHAHARLTELRSTITRSNEPEPKGLEVLSPPSPAASCRLAEDPLGKVGRYFTYGIHSMAPETYCSVADVRDEEGREYGVGVAFAPGE